MQVFTKCIDVLSANWLFGFDANNQPFPIEAEVAKLASEFVESVGGQPVNPATWVLSNPGPDAEIIPDCDEAGNLTGGDLILCGIATASNVQVKFYCDC